jgi:pimeloyl-ACP methyl ester carboxylesterase
MAERHGTQTPTVLALHGWGRTRHDWSDALSGFDALAVDLPGFGATPEPPHAWTVAEYADQLAPLLSADAPLVLVGHSFGGRVACRMAAANPAAVRALVLTGVPLLRSTAPRARSPLPYRVLRTLRRRGLVPEGWLERARRRYGSVDYRTATGVMRDVLVKAVNEDYADSLAVLRDAGVPVTLLWGELDDQVSTTVAADAQRLLGDTATLEVVPGSGHLLDHALTTRLRAAITAALPRVDRPSTSAHGAPTGVPEA